MAYNFKTASVLFALGLIGCGGGGSDLTPAPTPPAPSPADTTAPSLEISASDLSTAAGESLEFEVTATDSSGFASANITCAEGDISTSVTSSSDTQIISATFEAPATAGMVNCTATSTDSAGNAGSLDFFITVTAVPVDTGNFNGTWFSPCYNNSFGFSVRQTITINGTNLESGIESFTAGAIPAPNCSLPAEGLLITTDVTADLTYGPDLDVNGCVNGRAVDTEIDIQTVDTSGNPTATTEQEIADTLNLVTGFVDILPDPTDICRLENGNLLFAGVEYTGGENATVIFPTFDTTTDVLWSLGEFDYVGGGADSSASEAIGILVVTTDSDTSNGDFSGSAMSLQYTLNGSGVYRVSTEADVVLATVEDPTAKVVSIRSTVGTATTSATLYSAMENAGFVIAIVDEAGLYHFSTDAALTLDKAIDVGGGVPNAPANFVFEMTNLFDFSE